MKIPEFLKEGGTIGVTAPSFGATTEPYITRFNASVQKFKDMGYNVITGRTCFLSDGTGISTNPKDAARELMDFYLDDRIDAVISCGGGELMCETTGYIDFNRLSSAKPKWFMGYSDNTNFIYPLLSKSMTASIYGPCFPEFGRRWNQSEEDALSLLTGKNLILNGYPEFENPLKSLSSDNTADEDFLAGYSFNDRKILKSFGPVNGKYQRYSDEDEISFSGTLAGGCLDILELLAGTPLDGIKEFNNQNKDVIWVLEACDLSIMEIRRSLWKLDQCGWFNNAKGFLIGRPLAAFGQQIMGVDQYNAVTSMLEKFNVPVIMDADIGHIDPSMPLIMGSFADINIKGSCLKVAMKR